MRAKLSPLAELTLSFRSPSDPYGHLMTLSPNLTEVLIAILDDQADIERICDELVLSTPNVDPPLILAGSDGVESLRRHGSGGALSSLRHLIRHIEALDETGTGFVLANAEEALLAGRRVLAVSSVRRHDARLVADLLRSLGAADVRYIGRWTTLEYGIVPATDLVLCAPLGQSAII